MYEAQQDYFGYVNAKAIGAVTVVPSFHRILQAVTSYRAGSLSTLPAPWYTLIDAPRSQPPNQAAPAAG